MANRFNANPSFPETTPFLPPESHFRHVYQPHLRRDNSSETSVQNPFQDSHFGETLESAFARLNVSPYNHLSLYPILDSDMRNGFMHENSVNDYAIGARSSLPLSLQEIEQTNNELQGLSLQKNGFSTLGHVGFQDYERFSAMLGSDSDCWDNFVYPTSGTKEQCSDRDGFLSNSRRWLRRDVSNDFPVALHSDRNGEVNNFLSESSSVLTSSLYNRQPHWLQEPLNCLCVEDLRGKIVSLAKRQNGCRLLQRTIAGVNDEEMEMIFMELIDHVSELMLDPFGNYVVQKLVEVCTEEQRTRIILMVTKGDFLLVSICLNMHGSRAIQKLLEHLTTQQQISLVMSALSPGAVALTKDMNGHHVIHHCLKNFSDEDNKYLLNVVADNCFGIATDKSGCCVLQQCVEYSRGEPRERLVAEITANALLLAEDRYGNYVVQHILGMRIPQITTNLLRQLEGSYVALSCNKYGSNVVEKCLTESGEEKSARIIVELIGSPNASMLLVDPFGNYVIQSALSISKGFIHDAVENLVQTNASMLRSNLYGKKVLACLDRRKPQHM